MDTELDDTTLTRIYTTFEGQRRDAANTLRQEGASALASLMDRRSGWMFFNDPFLTLKAGEVYLLGLNPGGLCQFSESFRQRFFRIIPPLAGAPLLRVYGMTSPSARGLMRGRSRSARAGAPPGAAISRRPISGYPPQRAVTPRRRLALGACAARRLGPSMTI